MFSRREAIYICLRFLHTLPAFAICYICMQSFPFRHGRMYPTVKVMVHEQDHDQIPVPPRNETGISLLFLRTSDILSKQAKDNQNHSPPSTARITKVHVPNSRRQSNSACQGSTKNIDGTNKNTRPNIKANPALRPRAVLSSPDNDGMIGCRNRFLEEKSSKSTKVKLPAQAKVMDNQVKAARLLNTKEGYKEVSEDKQKSYTKQNA